MSFTTLSFMSVTNVGCFIHYYFFFFFGWRNSTVEWEVETDAGLLHCIYLDMKQCNSAALFDLDDSLPGCWGDQGLMTHFLIAGVVKEITSCIVVAHQWHVTKWWKENFNPTLVTSLTQQPGSASSRSNSTAHCALCIVRPTIRLHTLHLKLIKQAKQR